MEYIGIVFVAIVAFVLGYVLGRIIRKKRWHECLDAYYEQGRLDGELKGYCDALNEVIKNACKQKEKQKDEG